VGTLQIRARLPARLDTIEEIPNVLRELRPAIARIILDGFGPVTRRSGLLDRDRPADRVGAGELRHRVGRRHLGVGGHQEATPRNGQAALGTEELQRVQIGPAARSLAV